MKTGYNPKLITVLGIIIIAITLFVAHSSIKKTENYEQNGKKVECEVVQIIQGRKGSQQVEAVYLDESGNVVYAKAIMNRQVTLNETFTGLVLPEKPDEIYCSPPKTLSMILKCVGFGTTGLGVILIIYGIVSMIRIKISF